jgi:hypothetical protein
MAVTLKDGDLGCRRLVMSMSWLAYELPAPRPAVPTLHFSANPVPTSSHTTDQSRD